MNLLLSARIELEPLMDLFMTQFIDALPSKGLFVASTKSFVLLKFSLINQGIGRRKTL